MDENNKNLNNPVPKTRTQKIEEFLLNPDKVVFESLEEFSAAVAALLDILSSVDINALEKLRGEDGKTPERGVDYFNEEDIAGLEAFILSKMPIVGQDVPSVLQVENYIRAQVEKIPRVKGENGKSLKYSDLTEDQKDELRGKDGSPDSGLDIIKKIRSVGKNQMLKINDIRGLENVLKQLVTDEDFEALEKRFNEFRVIIPANPSEGEVGGGGDMTKAVYDPNGVEDDAFDMENMTEGATKKILTVAERAKIGYLTVTASTDLDAIRARVLDLDAAVVLRGGWAANAGTFPGGGTAQAGSSYIVTTAGTVNGIDFSVNDRIVAIVDNASTGTYAANWLKLDYTDQVLSVVGLTGAVSKAGLMAAIDLSGINSGNETTTTIGALINGATAKATPVDADYLGLMDSAASNILKKLSWANVKATLKTYFDTLYAPIGGSSFTWTEVTGTTQAMAVNNGYIANNAAQVVHTLPATAAVGSIIRLVGKGAGGWKIAQNASQLIVFTGGGVAGMNQTTTGTGGFVASNDILDSIELLCTTANTTFTVLNYKGNVIID